MMTFCLLCSLWFALCFIGNFAAQENGCTDISTGKWFKIGELSLLTNAELSTHGQPLKCTEAGTWDTVFACFIDGRIVATEQTFFTATPDNKLKLWGTCIGYQNGSTEIQMQGCIDNNGYFVNQGQIFVNGNYWWKCFDETSNSTVTGCVAPNGDKILNGQKWTQYIDVNTSVTYQCHILDSSTATRFPYSCNFYVLGKNISVIPGCYTVKSGRILKCIRMWNDSLIAKSEPLLPEALKRLRLENKLTQCDATSLAPSIEKIQKMQQGSCQEAFVECSSGWCIPDGWVCDGEIDCLNGADEVECDAGCIGPDNIIYEEGEMVRKMEKSGDGNLTRCFNNSWSSMDNFCLIAGTVYPSNTTYVGRQPGKLGWGVCEGSTSPAFYHAQGCIDNQGNKVQPNTGKVYLYNGLWWKCWRKLDRALSAMYQFQITQSIMAEVQGCNLPHGQILEPHRYWKHITNEQSSDSSWVIYKCLTDVQLGYGRVIAVECGWMELEIAVLPGCFLQRNNYLFGCKPEPDFAAQAVTASKTLDSLMNFMSNGMTNCDIL